MPIEKPWKFKKFQGNFDEIALKLTDESKQVFEQAKPHQGFVGLIDLSTGNIHLIPCFNYPKEIREAHKTADNQDDAEYFSQWNKDLANVANKNGEHFSVVSSTGTQRRNYYVATMDDLGTNTGVAHGRALALAGLSNYGGEKGGVIGFGVWKGANELISSFRDRSASQNRHAIKHSSEFLDDYLTDEYEREDPDGHSIIKLSRERSLPQEIGDKIITSLLTTLPADKNVSREVLIDGRVFNFPNPFISAAEQGNHSLMNAYLGAGMNINEKGNAYQWTALHACSNLEKDNPEKLNMLTDLLKNKAIKYNIKDESNYYFYDYLENREITDIIQALYANNEMIAAINLIHFLLEQNHPAIQDIASLDIFSEIYLNAKEINPNVDIMPCIKILMDLTNNDLIELDPSHPLFDSITFLQACKKSNLKHPEKMNITNLDTEVKKHGLELSFEATNTEMISHILNSIDNQFMQDLYQDNTFWEKLDKGEYFFNRHKKAKVIDALAEKLRPFNFEIYHEMRLIRNQLSDLEASLTCPNKENQHDTKILEEQLKNLQEKLQKLEKPLQFYSHKNAKIIIHSRKGFHQLLDLDKKFQQLCKLEQKISVLIQEKKNQLKMDSNSQDKHETNRKSINKIEI